MTASTLQEMLKTVLDKGDALVAARASSMAAAETLTAAQAAAGAAATGESSAHADLNASIDVLQGALSAMKTG